MRRWLQIVIPSLLAIAIAIAIAIGAAASSQGELTPAEPAALDPAIAAWAPLPVGERRTFDVNNTSVLPQKWTRVVAGWEAVDGEAHARIEMTAVDLYRAEWLRPGRGPNGEAQLVCTLRQLQKTRYRLDPPQPVLQTPLTVGATWTWSGRIGGDPCEATFRIVAVSEDEVRVEQRTVAGRLSSTHVRTYARGRGLVAENASLPTGEQTSTPAEVD